MSRLALPAACILATALAIAALGQQPAPQTRPAAPTTPPNLPTTAPTEAQIAAQADALIKDLSSNDWQTRQKAQDALVLLGLDARPRLLDAFRQARDEEVRTRLEAALRQLEELRATGPSIITIHMKGVHPKVAFAELARQASTDLRPSPTDLWTGREWPAIDVDIDHQPFWIAMKDLCAKVGVTPQNSARERDMVLTDRNIATRVWGQAPSCVSGPFLVVANYIHRSHYVDLNQPDNVRRNAVVQLVVYAEPKIRVLQASYIAKLDECVDNKGEALAAPTPAADNMQPLAGNWSWNLSVQLMPKPQSEKIARLKGSARFVIQTRAESVEIPNILNARNVTKSIGGRRFLLKEVRKAGQAYTVQVLIYRAGWNPNELNMMYPYNNFRLVDADDTPLTRINASNAGTTAEAIDVTLSFQRQNWAGLENAGEPAKLVWEIPIETKEIRIPFEFKDLDLP